MHSFPPCSAVLAAFCAISGQAGETIDWSVYLGDAASSQYSLAAQITPENVSRLAVAWQWDGPAPRNDKAQIQCNPLVRNGVVYATDAHLDLIALDAVTGALKWRLDPMRGTGHTGGRGVNRGLAWWSDGAQSRLLFGVDRYLLAIDPETGRLVPAFGKEGRVDLKQQLGRDVEGLQVQANTPGAVFEDLIIMPMRVGEGPGPSAPGTIRAYNVRTGKLVWRFRTIPHPGEFGYETWPEEAYRTTGGANVWAGLTIDHERGLVFCPTGSAAFDFWGGDRHGDNLFANCLLALDARTGERVWHYQFVHHDLWDRDLPAAPNLLTLQRGGQNVPAVAQITKSGHVFVFHRETGEPLFPIEERPVPASGLKGEKASPTQPLPLRPAPFARQVFSADEITDIHPESQRAVLERFVQVRPHVPFMPPSEEGTIIFPGFDGGGEWGGAAVDPAGTLYVNANEMPWILTMVETGTTQSAGEHHYRQYCAGCHGVDRQGSPAANIPELNAVFTRLDARGVRQRIREGYGVMPAFGFLHEDEVTALVQYLADGTPEDAAPREIQERPDARSPYTHTGYRRWLDGNGYPAVKPPWGTLHAIDLQTGEYRWSTTLGVVPELIARGLPPTGTENYGGPIVTAGGLLFIGASKDGYFRAFDVRDGTELWRYPLPAGGYATPATYVLDGRQFVLIACGGGKMGTASGNSYVAFALPERP